MKDNKYYDVLLKKILNETLEDKANPADNVDIPSCLDLLMIVNLLFLKSFNTSSWKGYK